MMSGDYYAIKLKFVNGSRERNEVKRPNIPRVIRSLRYAPFPAAIVKLIFCLVAVLLF